MVRAGCCTPSPEDGPKCVAGSRLFKSRSTALSLFLPLCSRKGQKWNIRDAVHQLRSFTHSLSLSRSFAFFLAKGSGRIHNVYMCVREGKSEGERARECDRVRMSPLWMALCRRRRCLLFIYSFTEKITIKRRKHAVLLGETC